ncbi:DUF58 domain-containing protein [Microvirga sp. W0021]|uniref:DUF58 domain-containing protein n=1 Tax=Hohaiivirga grylli TaxID=3133970 RepID=A0ABV0BJF5_9HYPH
MIKGRFINHQASDHVVQGHELAERLPALIADSKRVASSIQHGVHGRHKNGPGENFWQFRPFTAGEPANLIDWRRSGRDHKLYVREREWEAARTFWFWVDLSPSMFYVSDLATAAKIDRAIVITLALAHSLVEAGERVGLIGLTPPIASRQVMDRFAENFVLSGKEGKAPDLLSAPLPRRNEVILVSDFLIPVEEMDKTLSRLSSQGAKGHLLIIRDPVEETLPFEGQAILFEQEKQISLQVGDIAVWRQNYLEALAAFKKALEQTAQNYYWQTIEHHTDRPASEAALTMLTRFGTSGSLSGDNP